MFEQIIKWLKDKKIKRCSHPVPWIVLERSENIWWRAIFSLEFHSGERPENDAIFSIWCRARRLKCKRCDGTLDEIALGKKWLAAKELGLLDSPGMTVKDMAKEYGTIPLYSD